MKNRKKWLIVFLLAVFFLGCSNLKDNKNARYSLLKGINLTQQGDLNKALMFYRDAYKKNPRDLVVLKELGFVYFIFSQYDKAEYYWLEGLKLSPKDDEIIKNLITMYYKNKDYQKAIKISDLSYNPKDEYFEQIRGLIYYEQGDKKKAYSVLKSINKSNFDDLTYIKYLDIVKESANQKKFYETLNVGELLFENSKEYTLVCSRELTNGLKKYKEAENILLNYLVKNGNDKDVILMLSWVYSQSGNKQKASDSLLLLPKSIK